MIHTYYDMYNYYDRFATGRELLSFVADTQWEMEFSLLLLIMSTYLWGQS